jgi:hypothetical protein
VGVAKKLAGHVDATGAHSSCLFFETSGEFFGTWELAKAVVPQARERWANKGYLAHMEKVAQRYEAWIEKRSPGHIAAMRGFMKQMVDQQAPKAA